MYNQEYIEKYNPISYLENTFSDPTRLLYCMALTGTVISGSRALKYFVPEVNIRDADWDFYTNGNRASVCTMKRCLAEMGTKWDTIEGHPENDYSNMDHNIDLLRGIITYNDKECKVQLIWTDNQTALQNIQMFHSTCVQNVISGFGAFSMHYYLSQHLMSYIYNQSVLYDERQELALEKYIRRGIRMLNIRGTDTQGVITTYRFVGDSKTKVINFNNFLPYITGDKINNIVHKIHDITWCEEITPRYYQMPHIKGHDRACEAINYAFNELRGFNDVYKIELNCRTDTTDVLSSIPRPTNLTHCMYIC